MEVVLTRRFPYVLLISHSFLSDNRSSSACNPNVYERQPKPTTFPLQTAEIIELTRGLKKGFTVLSGDDNLTIPIMSYGGKGVVSVAANVLPKEVSQMVALYLKGDQKKALDVYYKLAPIMRGLFIETNPIPVKAAANMMGLAAGQLRAPLTTMAPDNQKKLQAMLEALGAVKKVAVKARVKK